MSIEAEERARKAQEVLDNGIIDEALKDIEKSALDHMLKLGAGEHEERRRDADMILLVRALRAQINGIIEAKIVRAKGNIRVL
jgi:hypothetical protein